tara:strand:- start:324 stop:521 length:198 start_codon:yes stop_codon:yes gene_type:complete
MKYNLFEINERLQNGEITSEQAHKELLILFDVVEQSEHYCDCDKPTLGDNVCPCWCSNPFKKKDK